MEFEKLKELGKDGIDKQYKSAEILKFLEDLGYEDVPTRKPDRIDLLLNEIKTMNNLENIAEEEAVEIKKSLRDKTTAVSTGLVPLVEEIIGTENSVNPLEVEWSKIAEDIQELDPEFTEKQYIQKYKEFKEKGNSALDFENRVLKALLKNNFALIKTKKQQKTKKVSFTTMIRAIVRKFIFDNNPDIKNNSDLWEKGYLKAENTTDQIEKSVEEILIKLGSA